MTTTRIMTAVALIVRSGLELHVVPAAQLEGIKRLIDSGDRHESRERLSHSMAVITSQGE